MKEKRLNPPFPWMGGKTRMRTNILPILESIPHDLYCEPFGGSAAILIAKKKSRIEVYNDSNRLLVNLFRELRNKETVAVFKELARVTPMAREFWHELREICLAFWSRDDDAVDKLLAAANLNEYKRETVVAFCFLYCMRIGFGGTFIKSYGGGKKDRSLSDDYKSTIAALDEYVKRLSLVNIENVDAFDIFDKYDAAKTLFYIDPPYTGETSEEYKSGWTADSTKRLVDKVATLCGSVVLSCYDGDLYKPLLERGFRREDFAAFMSISKEKKNAERVETVYIKATGGTAPRLF